MSEKIEIQGKTVEEAVNEALLRLGARRDEVDVTVLDEPKSGFLGILGGRPARIEVSRKRSRRRGQRRGGESQAHEFGESADDSARNRRGRRPRRDRNDDDGAEKRQGRESGSPRGGRGKRDDQQGDNKEEGRESSGRSRGRSRRPRRSRSESAEGATAGNDRRQDTRGRSRKGEDRDGQGRQENQERREGKGRNQRKDQKSRRDKPAAARVAEDRQSGSEKDPRRTRSRNQRGRRRSDEQPSARDMMPHEAMEARGQVESDLASDLAVQPDQVLQDDLAGGPASGPEVNGNVIENENQERRGRGNRGRQRDRRDRRGRDRRRDDRGAAPESNDKPAAQVDREERDIIDEIIATKIPVTRYAQAERGVPEEAINETIESMASGILVRAGFPARCEVKDGDYRQVRITTGDDGAAVLIGRHGSTIDSLEHLVERMISVAHGDRVRMNLDINNYRRRRSDSLADRVADAVDQVRASGKAYHVEPMNARERRIVHLAVEEYEGLRTYTLDGPRGRHVVIATDDSNEGSGPENDQDTQAVTEQATAPETVEAEFVAPEERAPEESAAPESDTSMESTDEVPETDDPEEEKRA